MVSSGYSSQLAFKKGSLRALWWRCVLEGMPYLAPLEALAKQRLSDLWETTLALLEQGKEEDERGNSAAAYLQYSEAIGGLQALLELEVDARRQELLRARLVEYLARLQQLNELRQEAEKKVLYFFLQ